MKKFILCAFAAALGLGASAQSQAEIAAGFYRVQNNGTGRYAYINDNTGVIDLSNTSADMGAVVLRDPSDAVYSDPATVCYITPVAHKHNVIGQNTSLKEISGHYVQFQNTVDNAHYLITPLLAGTSIYLCDGTDKTTLYPNTPIGYENDAPSYVEGKTIESKVLKGQGNYKNTEYQRYWWDLIPVDFTNEYLGITPSMQAGDKYYKPYIVGFDMQLGEGMKAYYVSQVKEDAVLIKEIEGVVVPANTPVIIECTGATAAANKVTLLNGAGSQFTAPANQLKGNYFCYEDHGTTAYKKYDAATMRVLAVVDGLLQYITDTENEHTTPLTFYHGTSSDVLNCLNANESYLEVESGSAANLPVMTAEEYAIWSQLGTDASLAPDIYEDGSVNVADANLPNGIAAMILEKIPAKYRADISKNGKVSIEDLCKFIQQLIDGKVSLAD